MARIYPCPSCGKTLVKGKHGRGWIILHLMTGNKNCS